MVEISFQLDEYSKSYVEKNSTIPMKTKCNKEYESFVHSPFY